MIELVCEFDIKNKNIKRVVNIINKLNVSYIGRLEYMAALKMQEELLEKRQNGQIEDTLILLEHPPVLTMGKRGKPDNILVPRDFLKSQGIDVAEISRGGDVTYHGPGQIVGYTIIDLRELKIGIRDFVWNLEEVFIQLLDKEYGIKAHREEKTHTGVWVGNEKITAIGLSVTHGVTMHGFAFNVNTNLEHFKWIVPCGIADKGVTSLEKLTGEKQDFDAINKKVAEYFKAVFEVTPFLSFPQH